MKKYFLTLIILTLMLFSPGIVKAETTVDLSYQDFIPVSSYEPYYFQLPSSDKYIYSDFDSFVSDTSNKQIFDEVYNSLINYYNENFKEEYPYYYTSVAIISSSSDSFKLSSIRVSLRYKSSLDSKSYYVIYSSYIDSTFNLPSSINPYAIPDKSIFLNGSVSQGTWFYFPTGIFESNFDLKINTTGYTFNIYKNNVLQNSYTLNDNYPVYYSNGYDSSISSNYTTVDLSKYYYVLLNLKDYSKKEAFSSNLQVKGMIGITPIYNYGTTEKDVITDRCNISYSDYTDYRLYILSSDLENKVIYAVKACADNSFFKFDNSLFDITYVTDDNIDDPIVTIDGQDYHTIPFDELSNSANKNEENNFVPGESKTEYESLSDILNNVSDTLSSVWNSLTTFMSLITRFFNSLPIEFRTVCITTFTIICVIGIIKVIKS